MGLIRTSKAVLRKAQIFLTSTVYENVGDTINTRMELSDSHPGTDVILRQSYVKKHVVYEGTFTVSFPGTDEPDEPGVPGEVFPRRDTYKVDKEEFVVTATSPMSKYYCVMPIYSITDQIFQKDIFIKAGESHTIKVATVGFVFGNGFEVNGKTSEATQAVLACENNSATIVALEDTHIIEFTVFNNG
jgi:hypothetical protein